MRLHHSISHLTKQEQDDLRHISKCISANLEPLVMFCFGIRLYHTVQRSCFWEKRKSQSWRTSYDLLMVLDDHDPVLEDTAVVIARRLIGQQITVNILVHRFSFIKKELEEGNFFLSWIHRSAILLINRNNAFWQLPPQKKKTVLSEMYSETILAVKQQLELAKKFLNSAQREFEDNSFNAALPSIRQSILCSAKALVRIGLGYDMKEESLEKLIKLSENFTDIAVSLFPANTVEEEHLYKLLRKTGFTEQIQPVAIISLLHRAKELKQKVNDYQFKNPTLLKYSPAKF